MIEEEEPKKEKKKPEELTCPEWMMTMGDAMSLLLCFFVLLLTFSTMEEAKLLNILGVLQGANAPTAVDISYEPSMHKQDDTPSENGSIGGVGATEHKTIAEEDLSPISLTSADIRNRFNESKNVIEKLGYQNTVEIKQLEEGISVLIDADQIFTQDTTEFKSQAAEMIQGFANLAVNIGNEIRITTNFSPAKKGANRRFSSDWGLAIKRAMAVGDLLTERFSLMPSRLGYGVRVITNDKDDYMEFMLIEKLGMREISIKELLSMNVLE